MNNAVPKGTSDEHYTPKFIFETLNILFDLDVAAPFNGNTNVPALRYFDINTNGLEQKWYGNIWMNPPYSAPKLWVKKFIEHSNGIALLPVTRGMWWDELWNKCDAIMPLSYNLKFDRPDGLSARPIVFRTALYAFGELNCNALKNFEGNKIR